MFFCFMVAVYILRERSFKNLKFLKNLKPKDSSLSKQTIHCIRRFPIISPVPPITGMSVTQMISDSQIAYGKCHRL